MEGDSKNKKIPDRVDTDDHHKTNIVTSITIANSLVIITRFTEKELSLAFRDWYKM